LIPYPSGIAQHCHDLVLSPTVVLAFQSCTMTAMCKAA